MSKQTGQRRGLGEVQHTCEYCGGLFMVPVRRVLKQQGRFCSLHCAGSGTHAAPMRYACEQCGAMFTASPARRARGMGRFCSRGCCYTWRRAQRPADYTAEFIARFWSHVDQSGGPDACWPWTGGMSGTGYGIQTAKQYSRNPLSAHRLAYELTYGPLGPKMCACHKCDVRRCCNPSHMFAGTKKDNTLDMVAKGRWRAAGHAEFSYTKKKEAA